MPRILYMVRGQGRKNRRKRLPSALSYRRQGRSVRLGETKELPLDGGSRRTKAHRSGGWTYLVYVYDYVPVYCRVTLMGPI
jgi:hypothetical protein